MFQWTIYILLSQENINKNKQYSKLKLWLGSIYMTLNYVSFQKLFSLDFSLTASFPVFSLLKKN